MLCLNPPVMKQRLVPVRVSELVGCNMTSLDFDTEMVRVRGKGNRERVIPIGEPAIKELREYFVQRDV